MIEMISIAINEFFYFEGKVYRWKKQIDINKFSKKINISDGVFVSRGSTAREK